MNGWAIRLMFGAALAAFVSVQTWGLFQISALSETTGRLDERVKSLTIQIETMNRGIEQIRAMGMSTGALGGRD